MNHEPFGACEFLDLDPKQDKPLPGEPGEPSEPS